MKYLLSKIIFSFSLLAAVLIPGAAFATDYPAIISFDKNVVSTTDAHVYYKMTKAPSVPMKVYASIAEFGGSWVRRDLYLKEVAPGDTVPQTLDVSYNFNDLSLDDNKVYVYFLADGTSDPYYYFLGPKCFTTKGEAPCSNTPPTTGTPTTSGSANDPFTVTETASAAAANSYYFPTWKITGTPTTTTKAYVSVKDLATGGWIRRDIPAGTYTAGTHANSTVSVNFTPATYTALKPNKVYAYYVGDATADPVNFFTPEKCFTSTGQAPCTATGVLSPNSPTTSGTGTGTASFSPTSGGTAGVLVKGECGPIDKKTTSVITSTSANLCNKGTVSNFLGKGPWTWSCLGANGGDTASCSAEVGTDDDLGDNFLKNPLAPGLDTFPEIFAAIVNNIVLPIAIPIIAIMFIYSGYLFVMARGKPEKLTEAKSALKYTFIGSGLVLGALVIANALQATVGQLLG